MNSKSRKASGKTFRPSFIFRNAHFQSIMASSRLRLRRGNKMLQNAREMIIQTPGGSRLLSFFSPHPAFRGLMILLHGWEGSSSSAYLLDTGDYYYRLGFSVCRLNLRDHGDSHHLNEDLFHGALIQETFDAVDSLSKLSDGQPVYLTGFSLGGNFALRIAIKHKQTPITDLQHVFAVSPPLDPYKTTLAIDNGYFFYRKYFLKKWKRSLKKKQRCFPEKYDFSAMIHSPTCIELTEKVMTYFPEMTTYRDYFKLYTLKNDSFENLNIPVTIFIAEDDPVIPYEDYLQLQENDFLKILRQKFGGHCGFIDFFPARCWYNQIITEMIT
ncbi:MAG TPA: alpha/beta fold hydrolase [Smithella sp.]|nr:alpha/beta fold hydrolase [Smithella sp.]HOG91825.1 alpha/beta fold hydrolase [Smithella sp.]